MTHRPIFGSASHRSLALPFLLLLAALLAACSSPRVDLGSAPARMRVLATSTLPATVLDTSGVLTQAAGDYLAVTLYVREVALLGEGAPVVLVSYDEPVPLDLMAISGSPAVLADALVPAGAYEGAQLRLTLDHAEITLQDEAGAAVVYELKVPSGDRSGYKVMLGDLVLSAEAGVRIELEFDVDASIVATGNGAYLLKPVVRAEVVPLE